MNIGVYLAHPVPRYGSEGGAQALGARQNVKLVSLAMRWCVTMMKLLTHIIIYVNNSEPAT